VRRVPAPEIEALVVKAVRDHLKPSQPIDDRSLVYTHVARIEVQPDKLVIQLAEAQKADPKKPSTLEVPWRQTPARRRREILLPEGILPEHARPIRSETRARLVAAIARGRRWLDELIAEPTASADGIAKRENCSARKIKMTISLAFLAPDGVDVLEARGGRQLSAYIAVEKRSVKKVLPSPFGLLVTHIRQGVPFHRVAVTRGPALNISLLARRAWFWAAAMSRNSTPVSSSRVWPFSR
jgi:hypothetical protein